MAKRLPQIRWKLALGFFFRFALPALAVFGLAVLLLLFAVGQIADRANQIDDSRVQQAIKAALRAMQTQMRDMVRDNAYWDDAVLEVEQDDVRWIDATWGVATAEGGFYSHAFILDGAATLLYAYEHGEAIGNSGVGLLNPGVIAFAREVIADGPGGGSAKSQILKFDGGLAVVGAAVLTPVAQEILVSPARLRLLVLVRQLDDAQIRYLSESYVIPDLRLVAGGEGAGPNVEIAGSDGKPIGRLAWSPQKPGDKSEVSIQPFVVAAIALQGTALALLLVFYWRSVSKMQQREKLARQAATHDALTGLFNRHGLIDCIARVQRELSGRSSGMPVLYIDLDGFKEINDTYGHAAGDDVIKAVATMLLELVPPLGYVARLGGDEFAVALPDSDPEWLRAVFVPTLLRRFSTPIALGERICLVGASVGLSFLEEGIDVQELLRRADVAMYSAKTEGGNRLSAYNSDIENDRIERQKLENDLRSSLQADGLEVVYQPIVDAFTQQIVGVEALARWM